MVRKNRLFAIGAVVLALVTVVASGAFTTVQADRSVDVIVAEDDQAYLGLAVHTGPNGAYADTTGDELEIHLDGTDDTPPGDGVNPDAVTHVDNVFNITNQGTQAVTVWIDDGTDAVVFHTHDTSPGDLETKGSVVLDPGETVQVSFEIDSSTHSVEDAILESITVHAEATDGT